jgi:hypothetical protein
VSAEASARLQVAVELADLAEEIMRANLRRRHPRATDDEIEDMLVAWYAERPGAEHGDAEGRPVDLTKWR